MKELEKKMQNENFDVEVIVILMIATMIVWFQKIIAIRIFQL